MELKEAICVLEERAKYAQSRVLWCIAHQEDEGNLLLWETAQKQGCSRITVRGNG